MPAIAAPNPLHFQVPIGGELVTFVKNPDVREGDCLHSANLMLKAAKPISDIMKGIRDTCHLLQHADLPVGVSHVVEHWQTVSGYAFGALAAPYWFSVVEKVRENVAKGEYGLKFSRDLTEVVAVGLYSAAPWIANKALSGGVASVGKVLITYPYVVDLQDNVRKLLRFNRLEKGAVAPGDQKALRGNIRETWYKISRLALGLLATLAGVFSILTGIVLPLAVTIGVLVASVGSVVFDLMSSGVRASEPILAM